MSNFTNQELEVLEFINNTVRCEHLIDYEDRMLSYAFSHLWNDDFELDSSLASDIIFAYLNLEPTIIDIYNKKIERNEKVGNSAYRSLSLMKDFKLQRDRIHYLYIRFSTMQMTHRELTKYFLKSNPTFMDTLDTLYNLSNNEIDIFKQDRDELISTLNILTVDFEKFSTTLTHSMDRKEVQYA